MRKIARTAENSTPLFTLQVLFFHHHMNIWQENVQVLTLLHFHFSVSIFKFSIAHKRKIYEAPKGT